ncbi:hypothetical protein DRO37_07350 [Candidatus Bathyarchaeota archaeon]|nr:MAG: hypothetical protein DRO37_07350 [Candidatus Bathyarchaeota archaeon]
MMHVRRSIAIMGWTLWDGRGRVPNGAAIVTYELTRRLSRYFDCEMIFETSDHEKAWKTKDLPEGFRVRFIPRMKVPWHLSEDLLREYDMIHIWDTSIPFTYRLSSNLILPHCYTFHSVISIMDWAALASALYIQGYDMISLGSRCLAEALKRVWDTQVNVIPYGVDTEFFKPMDREECREHLGIPHDKVILGYLGRISKLDVILAYETLREIKRRLSREDIMLILAGGKRRVEPINIRDDLIYFGYLSHEELPYFLNSCDIFFNPTAGAREGFGLTVVEAMSCGLPIVTSDWNGYSETVSSDVGFLARTCWRDGDVWVNQEDLISACMRLICDDELRAEMGRKARLRAERYYRWERCVDEYRIRFLDLMRRTPPEKPYKKDRIELRIGSGTFAYPISDVLKNPRMLWACFESLYAGFVSDRKIENGGWRRVLCIDNILNLPKYRANMKGALEHLGRLISGRLPALAEILGAP